MAEGGIDRATSQTESVPGQSNLYNRHSQVRQGLKRPKIQQPVRPFLKGKHWNESVPVHISLYSHLAGTENAPISQCNLQRSKNTGLKAILDTLSPTGKSGTESAPSSLCNIHVRASRMGNLHVMKLKALQDTRSCQQGQHSRTASATVTHGSQCNLHVWVSQRLKTLIDTRPSHTGKSGNESALRHSTLCNLHIRVCQGLKALLDTQQVQPSPLLYTSGIPSAPSSRCNLQHSYKPVQTSRTGKSVTEALPAASATFTYG
ncbi:hypothetical protein DPMN_039479 [Dreissena polymorpha]|uniref:Uncharacterized protein n=1 Tax=Dreissena polymorpha TaxID=45954 RepID=A0A9D4CVC0_DREPO|nr:hypothetical protein DPMN_039479 [Dreissena polymorpha]